METTEAAVVKPVAGTTTIGLHLPTPEWIRKIVRFMTWVTAFYALLLFYVDLKDFNISEHTSMLILRYSSSLTGFVSVLARFVGVKPPDLTNDN